MQGASRIFRALADDTRLGVLRLLRDGPRTSGDIAARFASSWPTVSRHLAVLREAGLVVAQRDAQEIRYELNTTVLQEVAQHVIGWTRPKPRTRRRSPRPRLRQQEG